MSTASGGDSLGDRYGFRSESRQVQAELFEELSVEQPAVGVELLLRAGHGDLGADHAGTGDAEDPLQILLRPESAELAGARADDGDRLVAKRRPHPRPGGPVDRVLEAARDRPVVLRCRE